MIIFQYTFLFFALLGVSIAAPAPDKPANYDLKPKQYPHVADKTDESLGWVYYAPSSLWGQQNGIVPVVVMGPPRSGMVLVVEITWDMNYLKENEKRHASEFFEPNTMLTSGNVAATSQKFRSLHDAWINVAKPRTINTQDVWWNSQKATALMKADHLRELVPLFYAVTRPHPNVGRRDATVD